LQPIRTQTDVNNGLEALLKQSPELTPLADKAGELPLRLQTPGFAGLCRIIIGQQVSRASADAIHGRFVSLINPVEPQNFLERGEPAWIEVGLSRAKQATISGLAQRIVDGSFPLDQVPTLPADEAITMMTRLKGIGPWTAEVYLLFCAGHPDIFPAGDLALREAVFAGLQLSDRPDDKTTRNIAENWSPHRGIAARLFWAYYRVMKEGRNALPV